MGKVVGSYPSVIKGVSEQVPQDRRPGQHFEQINMISDPVLGLARRHGSLCLDEVPQGVTYTQTSLDDADSFKTYTFFNNGTEYALLYRTKARPVTSQVPLFYCFNKATGKFINIIKSTDALLDTLLNNGVSTMTTVGKYLCIASNNSLPVATQLNRYALTSGKAIVWIRAGAYSRRFKVTCTMVDGSIKTFEYTTVTASYPGVLDTSDIAFDDTEYTKKVGDRTNAYNTAVTQWLGTAAAQTQPAYIISQLRTAAVAAGITCTAYGANLALENVRSLDVDDGADSTLIVGVADEVAAVEAVSPFHWPGKIVKVRPKGTSNNGMYLEAVPKRAGLTTWTEVTWRETAGVEFTPVTVFALGTIDNNKLYIAGNAAGLTSILPGAHPGFEKNYVGDNITSDLPAFFGKQITHMGVFQDRLMIVCGPIINLSRTGDYFNFFRQSVLSVEDNDPIEIYSLGSEDDVIRGEVQYAQSTILFGERKQYRLNGKVTMTPKNPGITQMTTYEHSIKAYPVDSGNYAFYARDRDSYTSLFQFQIGQLVDTPESFDIGKQLKSYLPGEPQELVAVTSPNTVFVRTAGMKNSIGVYTYLDASGSSERLFDSWSKWTWNAVLGNIVGMCSYKGDLIVFTLRTNYTGTYIAADKFVLNAGLSKLPYFDSIRSYDTYVNGTSWMINSTEIVQNSYVAVGQPSQYVFTGGNLSNAPDVLSSVDENVYSNAYVGVNFDAYVVPTNPYVRDRDDKAVTSNRLVITRFGVTLADTGGLDAYIKTSSGTVKPLTFTGRLVGQSDNIPGKQPIVTTKVTVPIGRANTEFTCTLQARTWLPLTITAIDYSGQLFMNSRRI